MKQSLERICVLVLALTLSLGIAGCGKKPPQGTETTGGNTAATSAATLPEDSKATEPEKETEPGRVTVPTSEPDSTKPSAAERPTVPPAPAEVQKTEPQPTQHTHSYFLSRIVSARCVEGGYTVYACGCGDAYQDAFTPALGHDWGDWSVTKDATYSEEGEEARTCSVCGQTETRATATLEAPAQD